MTHGGAGGGAPAVPDSKPSAAAEPRASHAPTLATYRIQLTPQFGFRELEACVPYLARLGVSHLYISPCLEAVPGSSHGYDVTEPGRVRQDFGGEEARASLFQACRRHGLAVLLDIVPNHMAASARYNPWWRDLLSWGPASPFARYFDVDCSALFAEPARLSVSGGGQRLFAIA